jgi:hypothetical protein
MPDLHHDLETGSALDLPKVGAWRYAEHPKTIVRCMAYAVDNELAQVWLPGEPVPEAFIEASRDPTWKIWAHNAGFERPMHRHVLIRQHGFPEIPLERWRCSMAQALACSLPGSAEKLADVLELAHRKPAGGARLIKRMCFPLPDGTFDNDPERMQELIKRCMQDVEIERGVRHRLPELSDAEQIVWMLDAIVNERGFNTDGVLLEAAARLVAGFDRATQIEIAEITAGAVTSTNQLAKLQAWLAGRGCEIKDKTKGTLKAALRRKDIDPAARRAIELRLGAAFDTKVATMIERRCADGRVKGCLQYHGCATGRWAARGVQVQNFVRDPGDVDAKIAAILAGDMDGYDQPLGAIADAARGAIVPAPGCRFLAGDFSGIESRVLAWIAGEKAKLDQWIKFDATGDPKDEPYYILGQACGMPPEKARQGKFVDLGFGYQGGIAAYAATTYEGDPSTDAEREKFKRIWRERHPATVRFWYAVDRAAIKAVRAPGTVHAVKGISFECDADFLKLTLPSGRVVRYPFPTIMTNRFGNSAVSFMDTALGKWGPCNFNLGAYGGLWVENSIQAIARDLLSQAMLRLDAAGFKAILTVHDEIVCEVPIGFGSLEEFKRIMIAAPAWAEGLPIAAKVREGPRFSKPAADAPIVIADTGAADIVDHNNDPENADIAGAEPVADVPIATEGPAGHHVEPEPAPFAAFAFTLEQVRAAFEQPAAEPHQGNGKGNGHDKGNGFDHAAGDYHGRASEQHAGNPYGPIRAALAAKGYTVARSFAFTVPGEAAPLYFEDRYELHPSITPSKALPRKTSRYRHCKDNQDLNGTGPRRILYHWPAIMQAGPGTEVFIVEGANKCDALNAAGLLATAAPYHQWGPECVSALAGRHLTYLEDHDHPDAKGRIKAKQFSADARAKLAAGAASFKIVPALHLWKNLGRDGEPPHGWDVKDWVEAGGEVAKLPDICRDIPADRSKLKIWNVGELLGSGLPPPRGWLYSRQLCRRFLSGLVAPGDAGKTTLRLTQAIELAAKRELLGHRIYQRCRVLIVSFEDDHDELWRRLMAISRHHGVDHSEIDNWLFCTTVNGPKLAERVNGEVRLGALDGMLHESIEELRPDLLILDPFVKLHALVENENADMDFVCTQLVKLAYDYDIAVDCPAHTRKGALEAGNADNRRGASAQRDAGRLDYTLTHMTEEEATNFGIDLDERKDYVRLDRAKANIVRRSIKASWFRMISVRLGNATECYPEGDEVQAIETWTPPAVWEGITDEQIDAILDDLDKGLADGRRYSDGSNAKDRAAWLAVQKHCPDKAKAQCREIIRTWLKRGVLESRDYDDPVRRDKAKGLFVNAEARDRAGERAI